MHAVLGCTFTHMWRLRRGEQVGCVIQALSPIYRTVVPLCSPASPFTSSSSSVYSIPDRRLYTILTSQFLSVHLPSGPQFPYLSYGGSTTALSWVLPNAGCCMIKYLQGCRSTSTSGSCCYQ